MRPGRLVLIEHRSRSPQGCHYRSDAKLGTVLKGERVEAIDDLFKKKR